MRRSEKLRCDPHNYNTVKHNKTNSLYFHASHFSCAGISSYTVVLLLSEKGHGLITREDDPPLLINIFCLRFFCF